MRAFTAAWTQWKRWRFVQRPGTLPSRGWKKSAFRMFSFRPSSCFLKVVVRGATGLFTCITHCIINVWWFYYSYYNLLIYYSLAKHVCCLLQKVEDTVENLESQLAALLQAIQDPKWRPLLDNVGRTTVDVLEDPERRSRSENGRMPAWASAVSLVLLNVSWS